MRILILNWRDIKNPSAGGAELLTHELASRWVKKGHQVTQFSASFPDAKSKETIDGIHFIRKGRWWSVHIIAFFYYLLILRRKTDIVIDEVHWFPFFSVLYAPKSTVSLVCEVARKLFFEILPAPLAHIFSAGENIYLQLYKNIPTLAISPSTAEDLLRAGHEKSKITILPMGLSIPNSIKPLAKEKVWTVIYLARLNKQKGILEAIEAFAIIHKKIPKSQFWIVGSGEERYVNLVKEKIKSLDLIRDVIIFGFVPAEEKYALLSRAHVLISASKQEGWGLTVHEAGRMGTPAVVYNVSGLRDTIIHGKTGLLVKPKPQALADGVIQLFHNQNMYHKIQKSMFEDAKKYNWDNAANLSLSLFEKIKRHA